MTLFFNVLPHSLKDEKVKQHPHIKLTRTVILWINTGSYTSVFRAASRGNKEFPESQITSLNVKSVMINGVVTFQSHKHSLMSLVFTQAVKRIMTDKGQHLVFWWVAVDQEVERLSTSHGIGGLNPSSFSLMRNDVSWRGLQSGWFWLGMCWSWFWTWIWAS